VRVTRTLAATAKQADMSAMRNRIFAPPALAALFFSLAATPAGAHQPPTPPPSGVVVHLFGPGSVAANLLPAAPAASSGTANPGAPAASDSPGWGDIAHQMFVTGNPAQEGAAGLSKGKTGGE
jgi:hypothetical protein